MALVVFLILGAGAVSVAWRVPAIWVWFDRIQLGGAIAAMSLTVFAVWILLTLVFGRIYCSTVCPAGTLMDVSARMARRGSPGREYRYRRPQPETGYIALCVWAVSLAFGIALVASLLDPYSLFTRICHGLAAPLLSLLPGASAAGLGAAVRVTVASAIVDLCLLSVIWIVAMRSGRGLCNSICPVGAVLGLVSRYSIFQIDIDTDLCTQCRRCEDVCKSHCIDLTDHVVDGSRCVCCFNCINVCENRAIRYTTDRKRLSTPMMERVGSLAKEAETPEVSIDAPDNISQPTENK